MERFDDQVGPLEHRVVDVLKGLMVLFALALAVLMVVTVILRYGVEKPFLAIEEAAVLLGLWLYFVSAAYVTGARAHIRGGALHLVVKTEKNRLRVQFLTTVLCLVISLIVLYYAAKYGWFTFDKGRKSTYLQWPRTFWVASMVFGFLAMFLFLALQTLRDFRALRRTGGEQ